MAAASSSRAPFRCALCRRSAFSGRRGHLYSAGHQRRLRGLLARLRQKVEPSQKALKHASVVPYDPVEHEKHFWCLCCEQEVKRHLSHGILTVLHGGLVEHMASFKASIAKALDTYETSNDEVIQQMAAHIRKVEQSRQKMVQAILEPQMETELCEGVAVIKTQTGTESDFSLAVEDHAPPDPSRSATCAREQLGSLCSTTFEVDWQEAGQSLTFIGHQETQGKGNVHTGAKPPWLLEEEETSHRQMGPSYEEFLKEKEKQKLKRLPPDRVGANFDHTSQTGEGWLPSFGRVWNHGRRWQSRHQFKAEAEGKLRRGQKTEGL